MGLGPHGLSYGQITTSLFLKVAVSDFLTLFTARAGERSVFTAPPPSCTLVVCGIMALVISTTFAMSFPEMSIDGVSVCVPVSMYVSLLPSYVLIKPLLIHALTLPLSHTQVPIEGLAHRGPDAFVAIIWVKYS